MTPSVKVLLVISRLLRVAIIVERSPWRLVKSRRRLTVGWSSFSSSKATLVCSGVTFSAWSMILVISVDLSVRPRNSSKPARILRLLMRASTGVSRAKAVKVSSKVEITSAS